MVLQKRQTRQDRQTDRQTNRQTDSTILSCCERCSPVVFQRDRQTDRYTHIDTTLHKARTHKGIHRTQTHNTHICTSTVTTSKLIVDEIDCLDLFGFSFAFWFLFVVCTK